MNVIDMALISSNGYADVQCPQCGDFVRVEPDADHETHEDCPESPKGLLTSPLRAAGLI